MSEMIERVANSIANSSIGVQLTSEQLHLAARAAIEAMREPTHAVFMAGREFAMGPREKDSVRERWKKQIDAALSEE